MSSPPPTPFSNADLLILECLVVTKRSHILKQAAAAAAGLFKYV